MILEEAREACVEQKYAAALPLVNLPLVEPLPSQAAVICCRARLQPIISPGWAKFDGDQVTVFLTYVPRSGALCVMDRPQCNGCAVCRVADGLEGRNVTMSNDAYKRRDLSSFYPEI